jgi:hypothetical protein
MKLKRSCPADAAGGACYEYRLSCHAIRPLVELSIGCTEAWYQITTGGLQSQGDVAELVR